MRPVHGIGLVEEALERAEGLPAAEDAAVGTEAAPIFSHKLEMWRELRDPLLEQREIPGRYTLSTHIVTLAQFQWIALADLPLIADGLDRRVWDLRDTEPKRQDRQRSFAGTERPVDRQYAQTARGWLAESHVATVTDGRFMPGLHQNLILPSFDLRWDLRRHRLALPLFAFRWKIVERLGEERRLRPYEDQRTSLSHTRAAQFAPHVKRRVDAE